MLDSCIAACKCICGCMVYADKSASKAGNNVPNQNVWYHLYHRLKDLESKSFTVLNTKRFLIHKHPNKIFWHSLCSVCDNYVCNKATPTLCVLSRNLLRQTFFFWACDGIWTNRHLWYNKIAPIFRKPALLFIMKILPITSGTEV